MTKNVEKVMRHTKLFLKRFGVYWRSGSELRSKPIFIMGYGRSGTTMLLNTFSHDMRIATMGENDPRIARDYLLIPEMVGPAIAASNAAVTVLKPILNSFSAADILDQHPDGKIIWLVRGYTDVISSANKMFGNRVSGYIRNLVEFGRSADWISKGMPEEALRDLQELGTDDFTDSDWMGLVWWAVNNTVVRQKLRENDRFLLVRYEELVTDPVAIMRNIYAFIGMSFRKRSTEYMNRASIGKGSHIDVHSKVEDLCDALYRELYDGDSTYEESNIATT